jgi:predicted nucleic acid-binding protein
VTVFVVDASVAAKWFNHEENHVQARSLLDPAVELLAPEFFRLEMDNIFCKWMRRSLITRETAYGLRDLLGRYPLEYHRTESVRDDAFGIAMQTRRSFYDCVYLALALRLDTRVVTADRKLYDELRRGPFSRTITWVGDLPSNPI